METKVKYLKLVTYLKELKSCVLAYSGGVDSTLLLKALKDALGDNFIAVTVTSPYIPNWEIEEAKEYASELGIKQIIIDVPIIDEIKYNPENRCYLCKKEIFSLIKSIGQSEGMNYVVDGTNLDDTKDYRPGLVALKELEIRSPLLECEITKKEVREISKELGLRTWDKPAYACLLTRIPYDEEIDVNHLIMIEEAEKYLKGIGFNGNRVRCHGNLARIEVQVDDRIKIANAELMDKIAIELKRLGFKHVTFDLLGYKMGSLN